MQLTLRDEILVVCDYEGRIHAINLTQAILAYRKQQKDTRVFEDGEMAKILFEMVEKDHLLEPWGKLMKNQKRYVRIGELRGEDPLGRDPMQLYYRLTPKGWKLQRRVMTDLYSGNFLNKRKGPIK